MASCYLINSGGNWTDTTKWAASDVSALANVNDGATPTASDDVFLTANSGQCTISATSVGKTLTCTGYTNTLTHNAFTLTISGSILLVAGMTYTPLSTSTLIMNASGTLTTGGKLLSNFTNTSGTTTLGDNLSFMASKVIVLTVTGSGISMAGFNISGNSATNRIFLVSGTLGTASNSVTPAGGTFANADFRDIKFSKATDLDLSAITGLSGDAGGNTLVGGGSTLTFTTGATQTCTMSTNKNWSDVTIWTSRVPLPQDDVSMASITGGALTSDMPRMGKSITWTGATGTPTWNINNIATTNYGSITLITGMNLTHSTITHTFSGRGAFTLTSAGKTWAASSASTLTMAMVGGTMTLQDAFIKGAGTGALTISDGTWISAGFTMSAAGSSGIITSGSRTKGLNITGSTVTLSGASATPWNVASTGMTFTSTGSTILLTDVGASTKTFASGGLTYNDILISGGGAGAIIFTGAINMNRIYTDGGGAKSITLPGSATCILRSELGLANGTNVITFIASAGSATLSKTVGVVNWNYVSLTNIISTGGADFYAGANSTDGGGNTGWKFRNASEANLLAVSNG